jgi:CRISPR-associated RAMP protein (TIGR02581 family)
MLKQLVNECLIHLAIVPKGPILIRSGMASLSGPDMCFVTTNRGGGEQVYLPGSSLKGMLRAQAERIARTLNPKAACNPFADKGAPDAFCGALFETRKNEEDKDKKKLADRPAVAYRDACPICRLFGSTWFAGRLATEDAYAEDGKAPRPRQRDGVGIDRFTGGAAHGVKFDLEVVNGGRFETHLHLRNFELWQLGLLGFLLQDLEDELVRIGAGKSRGLGRVKVEVGEIRLDFLGRDAPRPTKGELTLKGVGALVPEEMIEDYGLARSDQVTFATEVQPKSNPLRTSYRFESAGFPWEALGDKWVEKAEGYKQPETMVLDRGGRRR